jgi:hypothetical protein
MQHSAPEHRNRCRSIDGLYAMVYKLIVVVTGIDYEPPKGTGEKMRFRDESPGKSEYSNTHLHAYDFHILYRSAMCSPSEAHPPFPSFSVTLCMSLHCVSEQTFEKERRRRLAARGMGVLENPRWREA